jgi:hypothetical protein
MDTLTPTVPLYWQDTYLFEEDASVLDVSVPDTKGLITIILDKTIFYPQGGKFVTTLCIRWSIWILADHYCSFSLVI